MARMYSSTFIFAAGPFDEAFHHLDETIAAAARALPGYLGEESWEDSRNGLVSNVYYWESLAALQALMQHPAHLQAKADQARWLAGYQVVIAQVLRTYGDGQLQGRLPTAGLFSPVPDQRMPPT
jgi:heme-degrading monooxygenase HmoA